MPETKANLDRRSALFESLRSEIASAHSIGSDQFVYWDPRSVYRRCAPDVFVKLGVPDGPIDVWKVWQRGAPELAVEIVSASDRPEDQWGEKFARYLALGVLELVRFDSEAGEPLVTVWDRIDGELVERAPDDPDRLRCSTLDLWWTVVDMAGIGPTLRLARDKAGADLLLTPREAHALSEKARVAEAEARAHAEQERARAEQERARAEQERLVEAEARAHAEQERARAEQEREALRKELEALRAAGSSPRAETPKKKAASPHYSRGLRAKAPILSLRRPVPPCSGTQRTDSPPRPSARGCGLLASVSGLRAIAS